MNKFWCRAPENQPTFGLIMSLLRQRSSSGLGHRVESKHWPSDSFLDKLTHRIKTWLSNSVPRFMHSKPFQLCSTLGNPLGHSPPGSSVYGILQARYWSGFPRPPPDNPPNSRIEPVSLASSTPRLLKTGIQGSTCTWVSITTLFTIAKGEENSHVHKWRNGNKIQQICTIE